MATRQLPPRVKTLVEQNEAAIKAEFGPAFYDRLVEGRFRPKDFMEVWRFLGTLQ